MAFDMRIYVCESADRALSYPRLCVCVSVCLCTCMCFSVSGEGGVDPQLHPGTYQRELWCQDILRTAALCRGRGIVRQQPGIRKIGPQGALGAQKMGPGTLGIDTKLKEIQHFLKLT